MPRSNDDHLDYDFIGREKELKVFEERMQDVKAGKGQLVIVEGKDGVGKSSLINHVGQMARDDGFVFLLGKCVSIQQADPYQPFLEALAGRVKGPKSRHSQVSNESLPLGLMGMTSDDGNYNAETLPIGLIPISGTEKADLTNIDIQTERDKLFNTILDVILDLSRSKPLMIFIDDLQWADSATLQLLFYVARNVVNNRVLICLAYRPEELDHSEGEPALYQMWKQLEGVIPHQTINLDRMTQEEISEIIKNILGVKDVPASLLAKLYDESEGNPFFVTEVVKSLMDEGIIIRHGHIWDAGVDISSIRIPNTIKDVITHRIARLDEKNKRVLRFASVIGDIFTFDVLKEVTGLSEEELLDSIDRLMESDIIHETQRSEEEEFAFDHKLTRSVIYESMSKSRVRMMHKTVGDTIESVYSSNLELWVFELARHFSLGKVTMKSYQYSRMAGDKALRSLAFEKAGEYYMAALRITDHLPSTEEFDTEAEKLNLSMTIGQIYQSLDQWANVNKYYNNALQLCRKLGDKKNEVKALIALGHSLRRTGEYRRAEENYHQATTISEELGDIQSMAEIERGLGYMHWRKGENDDAVEHYNQSISFSMKAGDLSSMAKTFIELGNVYNHWGDHAKAIEYYEKSLVELERLNDFSQLARAHNNIGDTYLKMKEWDKAIEHLNKSKTDSEKIGNKNMMAWAIFNSAEAYAYKGDLELAERLCHEALDICETQDDKIGMNGIFKNLGIIHRLKGDWSESIENFNMSILILEMLNIAYELGNTYSELAKTYEAMAENMGAVENYKMAKELFDNVGAKSEAAEVEEKIKALEG